MSRPNETPAPFFRSETSAAPGDRLLLLSTRFPPGQAAGARRWEKLACRLRGLLQSAGDSAPVPGAGSRASTGRSASGGPAALAAEDWPRREDVLMAGWGPAIWRPALSMPSSRSRTMPPGPTPPSKAGILFDAFDRRVGRVGRSPR